MPSPDTQENLFPVSLDTIQVKTLPSFDFYISRDNKNGPLLYRSRSLPLTSKELKELRENGISNLWLRKEERAKYEDYLQQNLVSVLKNPATSLETRCDLSYNISTQIMQEVFNSEEPERVIEASTQVLNSVIEVMFADTDAAHNFLLKAALDYELYTHSIHVCLYGVGLAKRVLGISKQEALQKYGPGFLLHDIGKLKIPKELLCKREPLTNEDWEFIRRHPELGLETVKEFMDISQETESIILNHHERLDGSGYPKRLRGKRIDMGARICAIADVFDAISTNRPYQSRKSSFASLLEIKNKELPHRLDERLYEEFLFLFIPSKSLKEQ